jgi:hypothetical protein
MGSSAPGRRGFTSVLPSRHRKPGVLNELGDRITVDRAAEIPRQLKPMVLAAFPQTFRSDRTDATHHLRSVYSPAARRRCNRMRRAARSPAPRPTAGRQPRSGASRAASRSCSTPTPTPTHRCCCPRSAGCCSRTGTALPTRIAEVLGDLGLLHDDTTPAVQSWVERRTAKLPAGFGPEIRAWLVTLLDRDRRTRSRSHTHALRPLPRRLADRRGVRPHPRPSPRGHPRRRRLCPGAAAAHSRYNTWAGEQLGEPTRHYRRRRGGAVNKDRRSWSRQPRARHRRGGTRGAVAAGGPLGGERG